MSSGLLATAALFALPSAGRSDLAAQSSARRGVPAPTTVRARPVRDSALVRTLNGIEVLADSVIGIPLVRVRVIGTWGEEADQDSDALLTRVYVSVNEDGVELRAFALGQFLNPTVERMSTEDEAAVAYISYGEARQRMRIRIVAALSGLTVEPASASP